MFARCCFGRRDELCARGWHAQGYDGRLKRFCISCVRPDQYQYPRAHTCFNRLDLPNYPTEAELRQKMSLVINLEHEFGIE